MRTLESISEFFVGLDLGQKRDFSAFCVVERRVEMFDVKDPVTWNFLRRTVFHLRHLGRVPLGTPYPEVVERMVTMMQSPALRGRCELVVAVTITGGDAAVRVGTAWKVPKRDLVLGLQAMFEAGDVEIAGGIPETEKFVKELMGMQVKVSAAGHDSYGSWREGEHDDLVLAAALGCWRAKTFVRWSLHGTEALPGM